MTSQERKIVDRKVGLLKVAQKPGKLRITCAAEADVEFRISLLRERV